MRLYRWYRCRAGGGHWWLLNLEFGTKQCLDCHYLADSYTLTDRPDLRY